MARRIPPRLESVPPTMSPDQAIPLIERQMERLKQVMDLRFNDPAVDAWVSTTENILNAVFGLPNGEPHRNTYNFKFARSGEPQFMGMSDAEVQRDYVLRQKKRHALLEAYLEQLKDLAPPAAATAPDQYRFHLEIERVGGQLY